MFSKKTMVIAGAVFTMALLILVFSFTYLRKSSIGEATGKVVLFFVSPVQETISSTVSFMDHVWERYFFLVDAAHENEILKKKLADVVRQNHECKEAFLLNERLRTYLALKLDSPFQFVTASVVAKDPSPWYSTIIINQGEDTGIQKGLPVVVPEGIIGQVIAVSGQYAKVLMIIDRNSAVDSLVQRTRARGIARGNGDGTCKFDYALRKLDIKAGDIIISSGLDGIYPKGWALGNVSKIVRRNSGLFQDVEIKPNVDFMKLEEVMVILNPSLAPGNIE